MPGKCKDHSGFCEKLDSVVKNQDKFEKTNVLWQTKMEFMFTTWHDHINGEFVEVKGDIKDIKKAIERVPILWEKEGTTRIMVYGSYTAVAALLGFLFYHLNK